MKTNELKEIIALIEQSNIDVLKLEKGDFKLFYQKPNAKNLLNDEDKLVTTKTVEEDQSLETIIYSAETDTEDKDNPDKDNLHTITAPMIGTFYARPNPDAEPFVQVGTEIAKNETVCILEAMKLLNEIHSEVDGEIIDILVKDGQIIEFGQPLFTVRVSE